MLRSALKLRGYRIEATDGEIGKVRDVLFDDAAWRVRYLVVDVGSWLLEREVLLSPVSLGRPNWENKHIPVHLDRETIANSPAAATDKPVSRQLEVELADYFCWPTYWALTPAAVPALAGVNLSAQSSGTLPLGLSETAEDRPAHDPHLRSMREIAGYHIRARDGEIGHIEDFIIDDVEWIVRYVVVDTHHWWPGGKVILAPDWIDNFHWGESRASTRLTRASIKKAPAYNPHEPIDRDYEGRLHDHYGRPDYWNEAISAHGHGEQRY